MITAAAPSVFVQACDVVPGDRAFHPETAEVCLVTSVENLQSDFAVTLTVNSDDPHNMWKMHETATIGVIKADSPAQVSPRE